MKSTTSSASGRNVRQAVRGLKIALGVSLALMLVLYSSDDYTPSLFATSGHLNGKRSSKRFEKPRLILNGNHTFRIAIFADIHYGEQEWSWGIDQDINTTRVHNSVLDNEKPDLVVISQYYTSSISSFANHI